MTATRTVMPRASSQRPAAPLRPAGRLLCIAAFALAALGVNRAAEARQPAPDAPALWTPRPDALASWVFDPRPAEGAPLPAEGASLIESIAAAAAFCAASSGDGLNVLPRALLDHDFLRTPPFRFVLLDVSAAPEKPGAAPGPRLDRLAAVLEIQSAAPWASVTPALRKAAGATGDTDPAVQVSDTPAEGGAHALTVRRRDWPDWLELEACSGPGDSVVIGVGKDALKAWSAAPRPVPRSARAALTTALDAAPPSGLPFVEFYADLSAIRARAGEAFIGSPANRFLGAWTLANARGVLARGSWIAARPGQSPALVAVNLAWSERSEPPAAAHTAVLADDAWPGGAWGKGDGVEFAAVLRPEWTRWLSAAFDTHAAPLATWDAMEFDSRRARFLRDHGAAIGRVLPLLGSRAVYARRSAGAPDAAAGPKPRNELRAVLPPEAVLRRVIDDLSELFSAAGRSVTFAEMASAWSFRPPLDKRIFGSGLAEFTVAVEGQKDGPGVITARWGVASDGK